MTIRCHFDGKVFVPDEPVRAAAGQCGVVSIEAPPVEFTGGPGASIGEFLRSADVDVPAAFGAGDPTILSQKLRQRASQSNPVES